MTAKAERDSGFTLRGPNTDISRSTCHAICRSASSGDQLCRRDCSIPCDRCLEAPGAEDFKGAAHWTLEIPEQPMAGLSDIYLRIGYVGDVARLTMDGRLLYDDFYNGRTWEIGLKRFLPEAFGRKLEVSVLPIPANAPIYLDARARAEMNAKGQTAMVTGIEVLPE